MVAIIFSPTVIPTFFNFRMKPGKWYMTTFVITFLYFYIYAVNYVRGANLENDLLSQVRFSYSSMYIFLNMQNYLLNSTIEYHIPFINLQKMILRTYFIIFIFNNKMHIVI